MSKPPTNDVVATEPAGDAWQSISTDLPCECGYNLRGLLLNGKCPECGTDVIEALRRGSLHDADPRWRQQIRTGLSLLLFLHAFWLLPIGYSRLFSYSQLMGTIFILSVMLGAAAGAWMTSQAEPGINIGWFRRTKSAVLRCGIVSWVALTAMALIHPAGQFTGAIMLGLNRGILCLPFIFSTLSELAGRAGEPFIALTLRVLTWLLPASALVATAVWPTSEFLPMLGNSATAARMIARELTTSGLIISTFAIGRLWQAMPRS
jgi:hypothetical protein